MGVSSGPSIVTDDMVLCWDLESLPDCWAHIPTVNLISNPTQTWHHGSNEFHQLLDMVQWPHTYGTGVNFSWQCEMKVNITGNVHYYMQNGSYTKYSFASHNFNATTDWQTVKIEARNFGGPTSTWVSNSPTDHRAMLATYTGYGSGRFPYTKNMQLELGNKCTDFVNGSRSNTDAMTDLVGGGVITLNREAFVAGSAAGSGQGGTGGTPGYPYQTYSVRPGYDGSGMIGWTFKFDGSNDYITVSNIATGNDHTLAYWIKPDTNTGGDNWNILLDNNSNYIFGYRNNKIAHYTYQSNDLTYSNTDLTVGSWNHVVMTKSGTTTTYYLNGVADGGGTMVVRALNSGNYTVGSRPTGTYPYDGEVASMHVYNKVLSATEVAKNFNAQRSRFGV